MQNHGGMEVEVLVIINHVVENASCKAAGVLSPPFFLKPWSEIHDSRVVLNRALA